MKRYSPFIFLLSFLLTGSPSFSDGAPPASAPIDRLVTLELKPVSESSVAKSVDMSSQGDGVTFHVLDKPVLTLKDFARARVSTHVGVTSLELGLTPSGQAKLREFTLRHVGERLAFIVNGKLLKAPRIKEPIGTRESSKGLSIDPVNPAAAENLAALINKERI